MSGYEATTSFSGARLRMVDPRELAAPLPSREDLPWVKLFSPAAIGWVTFFGGMPAGFLLSALNYQRMGQGRKAATRLAAAGAILAVLIAIGVVTDVVLGMPGAFRSLYALLGLFAIIYLAKDAGAAVEEATLSARVGNAHWAHAALIGLGTFLASQIVITALVVLAALLVR